VLGINNWIICFLVLFSKSKEKNLKNVKQTKKRRSLAKGKKRRRQEKEQLSSVDF
jgi:hypothetical protein